MNLIMLHVRRGDVVPGHGLTRVGLAEMPGRKVMTLYTRRDRAWLLAKVCE